MPRMGLLSRALAASLVVACSIPEPETTLPIAACRYYDACEPAFPLVFGGVDTCIEVLVENPQAVDGCDVSDRDVERCIEALEREEGTCELEVTEDCYALTACRNLDCEGQISRRVAECEVDVNLELLQSICFVPEGPCVADCLAAAPCSGLELYPESLVGSCLLACEAL